MVRRLLPLALMLQLVVLLETTERHPPESMLFFKA
jgi:hypothetical protein